MRVNESGEAGAPGREPEGFHTAMVHLYRGEMVEILEDQPVVKSSVPLDPRELIKGAKIQRIFRRHGPVINILILIGGLALSGIAYLAIPAVYNQLVAGFYVVTLSLVTADTIKIERTWGIVKDDAGNPEDDAREVLEGFECGIGVSNFDEIAAGDRIEVFEIQKKARKLE